MRTHSIFVMDIFSISLTKAVNFLTDFGLKIVFAALLLVIGFKLIKVIAKAIDRSKAYSKIDSGVRGFIKSFVIIACKVFLVITAATIVGIPMTSVIAVLGSLGLAIGLAFQGSFSNVAGGLIILLFKPFSVGDFVVTSSGSGKVTDISIFYTKITTLDNQKIVVPNGSISNAALTNSTSYDTRRVDFTVCAGYLSDVEKVKKVLLDIASNHPMVLKDPEPMARLNELADSSLNFVFRVWCLTENYWTVKYDINEEIVNKFNENNISIPYCQMDIHLQK